jgi:hypothetical protein
MARSNWRSLSDDETIRQNGQGAEDPYERLAFLHIPLVAPKVDGNVWRVRDSG